MYIIGQTQSGPQKYKYNVIAEETEEDEEINDNICRQTDNQADRQTDTNSKTEAHSNPLWIVGERANSYLLQKLRNQCPNGQIYSSFIWLKLWDIRSFSRLQSLTLTFTRYYNRYRGTRLVSIWLDQGFKSYVMYCTVLYCTELYCTVPYCTVLYTLLYSSAQKLLLSRSIYRDSFQQRLFGIHNR